MEYDTARRVGSYPKGEEGADKRLAAVSSSEREKSRHPKSDVRHPYQELETLRRKNDACLWGIRRILRRRSCCLHLGDDDRLPEKFIQ